MMKAFFLILAILLLPSTSYAQISFWIDKKNLYFVRMLRPAGKDGTQTQETQFNKYQKLGGGWMAPEVIFMVDGKTVTTEKYTEIRGDVKLDPKLFDPQSWTTVHWKQ